MKDRCEACGSPRDLQEHHVTYNPEFKVTLCKRCHMNAHQRKHGTGRVCNETKKIDFEEVEKSEWQKTYDKMKEEGIEELTEEEKKELESRGIIFEAKPNEWRRV